LPECNRPSLAKFHVTFRGLTRDVGGLHEPACYIVQRFPVSGSPFKNRLKLRFLFRRLPSETQIRWISTDVRLAALILEVDVDLRLVQGRMEQVLRVMLRGHGLNTRRVVSMATQQEHGRKIDSPEAGKPCASKARGGAPRGGSVCPRSVCPRNEGYEYLPTDAMRRAMMRPSARAELSFAALRIMADSRGAKPCGHNGWAGV